MQIKKTSLIMVSLFSTLFLFACGGGGGSSSTPAGSGILTMSITDAKPMLPDNITNFQVEFEEVLVHKSGGGWISLPLAKSPCIIDLLQFIDGHTTEFVPPVRLEYGKYTQVRIVVSKAWITVDNGDTAATYDVTIPSQNLKTNRNFIFDVLDPTGVDIIVDFDLSMSLKAENNTNPPTYTCKPVLHLAETKKAATILGSIDFTAFSSNDNAIVSVLVSNSDTSGYEEYTKLEVINNSVDDPEAFTIFWLVPNKQYSVSIALGNEPESSVCEEEVGNLTEDQIYDLEACRPPA